MNDTPATDPGGRRVSVRAMEIATALLLLAIAALVLVDSLRLGMRWADDGPQAGYFPFYIGLALALTGGITLWRAIVQGAGDGKSKTFLTAAQLRSILEVLVPLVVYALLVRWLGLYVASLVFISYCMRRIGRYRWSLSLGVSAGVVLCLFVLFEVWFKLPLIKGPLEAALGLA